MKKEFAKLFIQLFAEESETTDCEDVTEEEEVEYTDNEEPTEEAEETSLPVAEPTEEPEKVKTFTQEEVDRMMKDRIKRERNRLDREHREQLSKYEELAYLTQEGLKASDLDETLEKSRSFYGKQGIKYTPVSNTRDDEILAHAYAKAIIEESDSIEEIEAAADRLIKKGTSISNKEKLVLQGLISEMESRQRTSELKKLGVKEEVYNSDEFKSFEKKFSKDTPISEVYELYRAKTKPTKVVENPGSMKSVVSKEKKKYITEAEYDRMTDKEIEENMDLIKESMSKW